MVVVTLGSSGQAGGPFSLIAAVAALFLLAVPPLTSPSASGAGGRVATVDGTILEGEYEYSATYDSGNYRLYWQITGDTIQIGLQARAKAYVALGLEPTRMMLDADMIIAHWNGTDDFQVYDAYSTGETGPHPPDTDLQGGTYDIMTYFVTWANGTITAELTRKLVTNDTYDHAIVPDRTMRIIWSYGDSHDFNAKHTSRGLGTVVFATGKASAVKVPKLWPYHATLMTAGSIMFVAIYFMHDLKRKDRPRWTRVHHAIVSVGAGCAITGLSIGLYMVSLLGQGHLRVLHAFVGVTTLTVIFTSLSLGAVYHYSKRLKRRTRMPHMARGGTTIVMVVVTVITGLMFVFPK
jgi:hypothetical protein